MQRKGKIIFTALLCVAVAGAAIGVTAQQASAAGETNIIYKETTVEKGNLTVGVTESGSVSIGTISQTVDIGTASSTSSTSNSTSASSLGMGNAGTSTGNSTSGSSSSLEVETVYVTVGQTVAVGDPILKITDDSVKEYKETLEDTVESARRALQSAKLASQSQQLEADYTYNSNVTNGNVAQSEYDATIAKLQADVDSAQAKVTASAEKIADYQTKISKGENLNAELAEEQANYNSLVSKLTSAQNAQTTGVVEAQEKYNEAMLNYNNASAQYSVDTSGISSDVEDAQETFEDANEALEEFTGCVGDGVIYAEYAGTISAVSYAEGDMLTDASELVTYEDSMAVTMTVSVSQEDISAVNLKDTVNIEMTAYEGETFQGTVESMDTSASSGTSTVSYDVTVVFTGDTSKIYTDMTGNVTFITAQVEDVLYVSNKAILHEGTASYVDVKKEDGSIEKIQVTTGFSDGVNCEISSGLEENQTVLIESQVKAE